MLFGFVMLPYLPFLFLRHAVDFSFLHLSFCVPLGEHWRWHRILEERTCGSPQVAWRWYCWFCIVSSLPTFGVPIGSLDLHAALAALEQLWPGKRKRTLTLYRFKRNSATSRLASVYYLFKTGHEKQLNGCLIRFLNLWSTKRYFPKCLNG